MIVTLNGYTINDGSTGVYLDVEVDGLELPPIRTSTGNYSGRDGGYIGAQFYAPRDITLQGNVFPTDGTLATLETTRKAFMTALKGKTVTLGLTTNGGSSYVINCNLIDFQMPILKALFQASFKLELLATDPTIYDNSAGGALTANITKAAGAGFSFPITFPLTFVGGGGPTTVANNGTTTVFPKITLTGSMTSPILTNQTTGYSFSLTLTTSPSDTVVIDMAQKTVLLNGGNVYGDIGANSTFFGLQPGNNSIKLTTSGGGDTVTGVVSWRSGFMGI